MSARSGRPRQGPLPDEVIDHEARMALRTAECQRSLADSLPVLLQCILDRVVRCDHFGQFFFIEARTSCPRHAGPTSRARNCGDGPRAGSCRPARRPSTRPMRPPGYGEPRPPHPPSGALPPRLPPIQESLGVASSTVVIDTRN